MVLPGLPTLERLNRVGSPWPYVRMGKPVIASGKWNIWLTSEVAEEEVWSKADKWRVINWKECEGKRPITKEKQRYRIVDRWRRVEVVFWVHGSKKDGITGNVTENRLVRVEGWLPRIG